MKTAWSIMVLATVSPATDVGTRVLNPFPPASTHQSNHVGCAMTFPCEECGNPVPKKWIDCGPCAAVKELKRQYERDNPKHAESSREAVQMSLLK